MIPINSGSVTLTFTPGSDIRRIEVSDIGIQASSATIKVITNSKGWSCDSCLFPIRRMMKSKKI